MISISLKIIKENDVKLNKILDFETEKVAECVGNVPRNVSANRFEDFNNYLDIYNEVLLSLLHVDRSYPFEARNKKYLLAKTFTSLPDFLSGNDFDWVKPKRDNLFITELNHPRLHVPQSIYLEKVQRPDFMGEKKSNPRVILLYDCIDKENLWHPQQNLLQKSFADELHYKLNKYYNISSTQEYFLLEKSPRYAYAALYLDLITKDSVDWNKLVLHGLKEPKRLIRLREKNYSKYSEERDKWLAQPKVSQKFIEQVHQKNIGGVKMLLNYLLTYQKVTNSDSFRSAAHIADNWQKTIGRLYATSNHKDLQTLLDNYRMGNNISINLCE